MEMQGMNKTIHSQKTTYLTLIGKQSSVFENIWEKNYLVDNDNDNDLIIVIVILLLRDMRVFKCNFVQNTTIFISGNAFGGVQNLFHFVQTLVC